MSEKELLYGYFNDINFESEPYVKNCFNANVICCLFFSTVSGLIEN